VANSNIAIPKKHKKNLGHKLSRSYKPLHHPPKEHTADNNNNNNNTCLMAFVRDYPGELVQVHCDPDFLHY